MENPKVQSTFNMRTPQSAPSSNIRTQKLRITSHDAHRPAVGRAGFGLGPAPRWCPPLGTPHLQACGKQPGPDAVSHCFAPEDCPARDHPRRCSQRGWRCQPPQAPPPDFRLVSTLGVSCVFVQRSCAVGARHSREPVLQVYARDEISPEASFDRANRVMYLKVHGPNALATCGLCFGINRVCNPWFSWIWNSYM